MGTFTNSEDPDEMPHNVAFHQGQHCTRILGKQSRNINTFRQKMYK